LANIGQHVAPMPGVGLEAAAGGSLPLAYAKFQAGSPPIHHADYEITGQTDCRLPKRDRF